MRCETCRELISAELDGEVTDDERARLDAHRASCAACASFAADAARLHRSTRIAPAAPVPDLTDAILERARVPAADPHAPAADRRSRRRAATSVTALQYGLLVVALTIAVLSVPELLASSGSAIHTSRHLGGWDLAFAVGLALAAFQPWRARGLVPMATALAGVMVITAGIDIAHGSTPSLAEGSHLLELFGLLFLWLLSRTAPGRSEGRATTTTSWRDLGRSWRGSRSSIGHSPAVRAGVDPSPATASTSTAATSTAATSTAATSTAITATATEEHEVDRARRRAA